MNTLTTPRTTPLFPVNTQSVTQIPIRSKPETLERIERSSIFELLTATLDSLERNPPAYTWQASLEAVDHLACEAWRDGEMPAYQWKFMLARIAFLKVQVPLNLIY